MKRLDLRNQVAYNFISITMDRPAQKEWNQAIDNIGIGLPKK